VFKGSISTVLVIAPGRARGEALARLFLAACLGPGGTGTRPGPRDADVQHANRAARVSAVLAAVIGLVARRLLANRPALVLDEVRDPARATTGSHARSARGTRSVRSRRIDDDVEFGRLVGEAQMRGVHDDRQL